MSSFKGAVAKRIRAGKKREDRAKNDRYYARNAHPNYRTFPKQAEYRDEQGRLYVLGQSLDPTVVQLNVKLPPGTEWFKTQRARITLIPLLPQRAPHTINIRYAFIENTYTHRTGHVLVSKSEWSS
jgi:hypothetical protein